MADITVDAMCKHRFIDWNTGKRILGKIWFRVCATHDNCHLFQWSDDNGMTWQTTSGCRMPDYAG